MIGTKPVNLETARHARETVWFSRDGDLWRLDAGIARRIGSLAGLPAAR
jgi:hypothetical protein